MYDENTLPVGKLMNLGPRSQQWLNAIGIFTKEELAETGAVAAYMKLLDQGVTTANMNLLYALVGAVEGVHWREAARHKEALLLELKIYSEDSDG